MGVLDEAIRQHLELKRRRGADAGEIKREEDEALGEPVRASRAPSSEQDQIVHQPTEAFNPEEVAEALGQMPDETIGEQIEPEAVPEPEPETEQQPVAEPQHQAEIEPDPSEPDEGATTVVEPPAEEAETPAAAEQETAAKSPESDADDTAADELEETPEFLEDAPEHDKLWFEQKPPKDFDF